ncbi:zonular occludens toxin domain-containing protein [Zoogloea sp.]|uniref:zonular occludens toxin domain-containing protein n=1 Tax=Zoogloea sp. TaxID=49181 RepID=UPI001AC2E986|nr:zonular occludens toxin domain-containing protein [Zoogloea sp.]MBN8281952.1 hypothetical protein [Zoogloea sp.]
MIIFHSGLPRSGKSHGAIKDVIIPAIKSGRKCQGYIAGLNVEGLSLAADLDQEIISGLLDIRQREDVPDVWRWAEKDSLIFLDEIQNFFPSGREKLSPEMTEFISEHGHLGIDLLIIGQDMKDVHALWRRRVSQLVTFQQMDAIGASTRYREIVKKATAPEKFVHVSSSIKNYDPLIFACYKSHEDGVLNKASYNDERANILKSPLIRYGVPGALAVFLFAGFYVYQQIAGGGIAKDVTTKKPNSVTPEPAVAHAPAISSRYTKRDDSAVQRKPFDTLFDHLEKGDARIVYFALNVHQPGGVEIWIEVRREGQIEFLTLNGLRNAGFTVSYDRIGRERFVLIRDSERMVLINEARQWVRTTQLQ